MRRRDRQAQGADGNESSGALRRQQRPMERGGSTGDLRQRPLAVTRRHAARREGSGKGAAEPRSSVSGVGRWGGGAVGGGGLLPPPPLTPGSSLRPCVFSPNRSLQTYTQPSPFAQPKAYFKNPTSFPGSPPHTQSAPSPRALPPTSPPNHPHPSSFGCKAPASAKPFSVPSH